MANPLLTNLAAGGAGAHPHEKGHSTRGSGGVECNNGLHEDGLQSARRGARDDRAARRGARGGMIARLNISRETSMAGRAGSRTPFATASTTCCSCRGDARRSLAVRRNRAGLVSLQDRIKAVRPGRAVAGPWVRDGSKPPDRYLAHRIELLPSRGCSSLLQSGLVLAIRDGKRRAPGGDAESVQHFRRSALLSLPCAGQRAV